MLKYILISFLFITNVYAYTGCVYPSGSGCVPTVGYIYYADGSCHADYCTNIPKLKDMSATEDLLLDMKWLLNIVQIKMMGVKMVFAGNRRIKYFI